MTWILTYTGQRADLLHPDPAVISLRDIAHHLARIGRFTGAGDQFLSVAQHCAHVSLICPPELAQWGLLHDASEAYLGDVSSPLKQAMCTPNQRIAAFTRPNFGLSLFDDGPLGVETFKSMYDALQAVWQQVISDRFGIPIEDIKRWDIQSALTERRDNGPYGADEIDWFGRSRYPGLDAHPQPYEPWTPGRAESVYLQRARELGIE